MEYMYQAVIGLLMLAAMGWLMSRKLKLAGAAPLALMIVMLLSIAQPGVVAAATVSKTFTTHTQVSAALLVYGGETFTFNVSGTFVGTVKLQKSLNGSAWENVISTNAAYSRTIYADAGKGQREYYRVFASTHTSGSIVTALADVSDLVSETYNSKGAVVKQLYDDGELSYLPPRVSSSPTSGFAAGFLGVFTTADRPSNHKKGDTFYDSTLNTLALSTEAFTNSQSGWQHNTTSGSVWTTY